MPLIDEAETCRREAVRLAGKPEARFLLQMAEAFEELAAKDRNQPGGPQDRHSQRSAQLC